MDLTATFFANPLHPAVWARGVRPSPRLCPARSAGGRAPRGLVEIGHDGAGFAFDCEGPRHRTFLHPHALADRTVTNAEWLGFIADGGYDNPLLWLADGWAWVRENGIEAPLYWVKDDGGWSRFALDGLQPVDLAEPVMPHLLLRGRRLCPLGRRPPADRGGMGKRRRGVRSRRRQPARRRRPGPARSPARPALFGNVWEWTGSAYLPYPGFKPAAGAVGEYNGKFMCSQMVLRGGCCATPRGHMRASYRNFFYPHQRWMYSGLRLAKDL